VFCIPCVDFVSSNGDGMRSAVVSVSLLLKTNFLFLQGVDYVFHMASPFLASWEDTQKELVEPALEGTTTVLESVAKSKDTIRRVVLTSSFAGMLLSILSGFELIAGYCVCYAGFCCCCSSVQEAFTNRQADSCSITCSCTEDEVWPKQWQAVHRRGLEHRLRARQGGWIHV